MLIQLQEEALELEEVGLALVVAEDRGDGVSPDVEPGDILDIILLNQTPCNRKSKF